MKLDLPNWLSGLGQPGWVAIILLVAFAVITSITIFMIWKLMRETSRPVAKNNIDEPSHTPSRAPARTKPAENAAKPPEEKVDPVAEAEVFLTYGLYKQAINVLEKHLIESPADKKASEMLDQARKKSQ